jgi:hypothetical protein
MLAQGSTLPLYNMASGKPLSSTSPPVGLDCPGVAAPRHATHRRKVKVLASGYRRVQCSCMLSAGSVSCMWHVGLGWFGQTGVVAVPANADVVRVLLQLCMRFGGLSHLMLDCSQSGPSIQGFDATNRQHGRCFVQLSISWQMLSATAIVLCISAACNCCVIVA